MGKARRINLLPTVSSRDQAADSLKLPGDSILVVRGQPRMLLMRCPCGCGDDLSINLDSRVGPAWRHYVRRGALTLHPSYWRVDKCRSHFILWKNDIWWCTWEDYLEWQGESELETAVLAILSDKYVSYEKLADQLDEVPWEVLKACYGLVRRRKAERNPDHRLADFRKK